MIIIPAIDIRGGNVVRLRQGDFSKETVYSNDAVDIARKREAEGAQLLHIVDLDGALTGEHKNLAIIENIIKSVETPVQVGGGMRSKEIIKQVLDMGAKRVVVGTRAYEDENFTKEIVAEFQDKIAVSIDAVGQMILAQGWKKPTSLKATNLAKKIEGLGIKTIIYTDILRDGTMERPRLTLLDEILSSVKIDVIVSGGISSIDDIKDLKHLKRKNLYGVIVGKALYEGKINLAEANKIAK